MKPEQIIDAFIKVIREQKYIFLDLALEDISALLVELRKVENEKKSLEEVVESIRNWYIHHDGVRDAILDEAREISKVEGKNTQNSNPPYDNRNRVIQDELENVHRLKKKESGQ